jgi:putative oxidoreductase
MDIFVIVIQVVLSVSFFMFGLLKFGSKQMVEEFNRYNFPSVFRIVTGLVEIGAAILMIIGIWYDALAVLGSLMIVGTMIGAILTHLVRVKDPLSKVGMPFFLFILGFIVLILKMGTVMG